jgi:hypothetical protein
MTLYEEPYHITSDVSRGRVILRDAWEQLL